MLHFTIAASVESSECIHDASPTDSLLLSIITGSMEQSEFRQHDTFAPLDPLTAGHFWHVSFSYKYKVVKRDPLHLGHLFILHTAQKVMLHGSRVRVGFNYYLSLAAPRSGTPVAFFALEYPGSFLTLSPSAATSTSLAGSVSSAPWRVTLCPLIGPRG